MSVRVLAIAAHPDDAELGAGATLAKHASAGAHVHIWTFGAGRDALQTAAARDAALELGVKWRIVAPGKLEDQRFELAPLVDLVAMARAAIDEIRPDVVYTHSAADLNRDHRLVLEAVLVACRPIPGEHHPKRLLSFETPSTTEWGSPTVFRPTLFVDITGEPLEKKLAALRHYASELRQFPHPRSIKGIRAMVATRGATAGVDAAEAFEVLREIA